MRKDIQLGDKKIILIGTAHISKESILEVEQIIQDEKPDSVCVELCASRYESIKNADHWKNMDIVKVIRQGKASLLMVNLILSAFQKKMGDKLGVRPGAEMLAALDQSSKVGAKEVLVDRDVGITLKRAWGGLTLWEKVKLLGQLIGSGFESPEISSEEIESLKEKDFLSEALNSLGEEMPGIKRVIIDERDRYMATKILRAEGNKVVAVLGAGHLPGITAFIGQSAVLEELETIPKPKLIWKLIKWGLPLAIIGVIVYGFLGMESNVSMEMIKRWVLANGILAAIGALLAGGHILTVISAFIAAPITSLNPAIAAGWVSGLTEAWLRKPKVEDFENLPEDIKSFKGFRRNEITKILMVVVFSNVGSSLGTFIGIPLIASLL
ncbi:MAG: TraB/GumN family protein [Deltaproteobacteria bacterium]|nr:TraB/GumN family protein [Deltaproteobacteria bacterium]